LTRSRLVLSIFEEEMKLEASGTADPDRMRTIEVEEFRKDGSSIWLEVNLSFLRDENQKAVGILSVSRDTGERKRAEDALRKSEEYFRAITENASDIIFILDGLGIITYASPSIERFIGYPPDELLGKSSLDLILPADHPRAIEDFGQALLTKGVVIPNSFRVRHKDGHERILEGVGMNLMDNPAIAGFVMNVRDVTDRRREEEERKNLETKLRRAQKMEAIGLMAGGVAHDLNNMLSAFVSLPELILMDIPEENQKLRGEIQMIMSSGQRTAAIVDDLLTITRGVTMARDALNLNNVVQEYVGSPEFEKLMHFHPGIEVVTELEYDLLPIRGSRVHLMKALMNLVSNAAEAFPSSDSGVVSVSTQNRYVDTPLQGYERVNIGEYVVLVVKDDGMGISPEDMERIFEPFYTKKVMGRSGTGLGLSVVWNTVTGHDGYIHVESGRGGTVFELYFPITRESLSEQEKPLEVKQYQGRGEKVLVVDDELDQRAIAMGILNKLGYQAEAVSGGQEALEFLKEHDADILLLDMVMPGMDGCDTFSRIVQLKPGQKAVIASGFSLSDRVKKAQESGAGAYIRKPYSVEKLGLAIKTELDKSL
jgi:two-component system cell cycle sensor histidine kinase/response regulator CckA